MTTAAEVIKRMGLKAPCRKGAYLVPCVCHEDNPKSPSLNISDGRDGNLLLWCFGGCSEQPKKDGGASFKKILDKLIELGYADVDTVGDSQPHFVQCFDQRVGTFWGIFDEPKTFVEIYPRYDRETRSTIVTFKARYSPKDFRWFKPHAGEQGKWKMTGAKSRIEDLPPYYYPEIVLEKDERVLHWPEGEKDADTLRKAFGLASFSFGGVNDTVAEWFLDELVGVKAVVVWADNDPAGLKAAQNRALMLWQRKIPIKLAVSPVGKDVSNWKASGGTLQQVSELVKNLPPWVPPAEQVRNAVDQGVFPASEYDVGTEAFAGDYLAHRFKNKVKFVAPGPRVYTYGEGVWTADDGMSHYEYAKKLAPMLKRDMASGLFDQMTLGAIDKLVTKVQTSSGAKAVITMARSVPTLRCNLSDLDSAETRHLFNCQSGVINMHTLDRMSHSPDFLFTKIFPTGVDLDHEPVEFIQFLRDLFRDEEIVKYMQPLLGYAITGEGNFQRFLMFTGESGAGKSQLLRVLKILLGSYVSVIAADSLRKTAGQRSAGVDSDLAKTAHARIIVANELSEKYSLDESLIKALSGGDPVPVKFMGGNKFELKADALMIFTANERPPLSDDSAIARRLMEIRFENKIAGTPKEVENFADKLVAKCGAQIAGWLLRGASMCYGSNFDVLKAEPRKIKEWTADYVDESNVCKHWVEERIKRQPGMHARSADLFDDFEKYCKRARLQVDMNIRGFGRRLLKMGFVPGKNHIDQRGFKDVMLKGEV